jgi:DNA-binding XRE family transcriptional regulator
MDNKFLLQKRIDAGLSQARIADILGYSVQTISLWESDKGSPSLPLWGKYASLLKVDLEGFLFNKDKKDNDYCDTYSFDVERFSNNLRRLRKHSGVTQAALAKAINTNTTSIIRFEKGTSFPSLNQFISLCNFYNQGIDELYFATSFKKSSDSKKNKKGIILSIILPIVVVVAAGGITTGVVLSNNNQRNLAPAYSGSDTTSITYFENNNPADTQNPPNVEIIEFGYYPQMHVSDASLIDDLNELTVTNAAGYYEFENNYYYKVTAQINPYGQSEAYYFDDNTKINDGETYWFRCDPIEWTLFEGHSNEYKVLLATKLIDSHIWNTTYDNNYKDSTIRSWLNNEFYTMAFSLAPYADQVIQAVVWNNAYSTGIYGIENNPNFCGDTFDKVYLPGGNELWWNSETFGKNEYRMTHSTEFNRVRNTALASNGCGAYWSRSPSPNDTGSVLTINEYGAFNTSTAANSEYHLSIRPMIRIPW